MTISDKKFVGVSYDLFVGGEDGKPELMEKATAERPLKFTFGLGMMLDKFEDNLKGLSVGDKFNFTINSEDAYGDYEDERIIDLDKSIFVVDGAFDGESIAEGKLVPMMDSEGNKMNGIVLEVSEDKVKMDFNHPLAGETLNFVGEVLEVRDATEEEIAVVTNKHHCGGCGGSCDDCSSECGGNCGGCGE
ncbi:MAG: FKBP-type peptidyl-prolyl cis-trans isomerase [Paludibacteraceae bacterium]|nr:FKBP-type peptidyl-prolyl cis-trans isomerase [Prevotellaceae bacterium]